MEQHAQYTSLIGLQNHIMLICGGPYIQNDTEGQPLTTTIITTSSCLLELDLSPLAQTRSSSIPLLGLVHLFGDWTNKRGFMRFFQAEFKDINTK